MWSNQEFIPNYGERYRNGERIASGFVESAVNQVMSKRMAKHQQMQWSQRGAHLSKLRRATKPPDPPESPTLQAQAEAMRRKTWVRKRPAS